MLWLYRQATAVVVDDSLEQGARQPFRTLCPKQIAIVHVLRAEFVAWCSYGNGCSSTILSIGITYYGNKAVRLYSSSFNFPDAGAYTRG